MIGWAFAIGLLLLPATAFVLIRTSKRKGPKDTRWLLAGLAAAGLVAFFTMPYTIHGCMEGQPPWSLYVLPLGSLAAVLWLLRPRALAVGLAAGFAGAFVALIFGWTEVVHRSGLTGNPDTTMRMQETPLYDWKEEMLASDAAADEAVYPEGWLDESPIPGKYPRQSKMLALGGGTAISLPQAEIHTVLSGLYAMRPTQIRYWYPGGRLRDALPGVEARIVD